MSEPKKFKSAVVFPLTPGQFKKLSPVVKDSRGMSFFVVVGQVDLLPWNGPYKRAELRAAVLNREQHAIVGRALLRALGMESFDKMKRTGGKS